ncbi:MAG: hypothetical protein AAF502_04885 [Bacteroidota bacterium]
MDHKESLLDTLKILYKWRKYIIYTCGITAVGAVVITLLMQNYYKASTEFFPSNPYMSSAKKLYGGYDDELYYFGGKNELDQILSITNSTAMADRIVNNFGLYEHYEVEPDKKKAGLKVRKKFYEAFNVQKNARDAVEMSFEDTDPNFAAQVLQGVVSEVDTMFKNLISANQRNILATLEKDIEGRAVQVNTLTDSLTRMRTKYGIYDIGAMSETLPSMVLETETELAFKKGKLTQLQNTRGVKRDSIIYLAASVQALESKLEKLTSPNDSSSFNLTRFNEGLELVRQLEKVQQQKTHTLNSQQERYSQLLTAFNSKISSLVIVEPVMVPESKSRPVRSLIVISACFVAFIFSIIGVLLFHNYRDVNWKEIING